MEKSHNTGNFLFMIFWWFVQRLNPHWAHRLLYWGLRDGSFPSGHCKDPRLKMTVWGRQFLTPLGIGDGVDKRGNILDPLIQIGFSFGEFGPYTLEKEMPAIDTKYYKKDRAILVQCAGYRNPGITKILPWLIKRRYLPHFVGVDLVIPAESEELNIKQGRRFTYQDEFVLMTQKVAPYVDFLTIDFSHPSSELYMMMVDASTIVPILRAVKQTIERAAPIQMPKLLVKIPLDLNTMEAPLVAQLLMDSGVDGVVIAGPMSLAKNTSIKLNGKRVDPQGMLTGAPTHTTICELIRKIYRHTQGKLTILGCGGIFSGKDAFEYIAAGASLLLLDRATLTYEGPTVVNKLNKELGELLEERGFATLQDAIGSDFNETKTPI